MHELPSVAALSFGAGAGPGDGRLLDGWSHPEDGFTWATGRQARFVLDVGGTAPEGCLLLELDLNPFAVPGSANGQRLTVTAGGAVLAQERIVGEGTVAYELPRDAWPADGWLVVSLAMPDAHRPVDVGFGTDRRELGFMLRHAALRVTPNLPPVPRRRMPPLALPDQGDGTVLAQALAQVAGLPAADLLGGFESLGHNCEFGIAQRHVGAEPLGLLRFAGITLPDLLRGLECGFAEMGEDGQLEILLAHGDRREFMARDNRHRVSLHTLRYEDEAEAGQVRIDAQRHMRFLRRKFVEDLRADDKMFVFQRGGQTLVSQMRPLLQRLRLHGHNALLFMAVGDTHEPGTVEELGYGLFRGWTDRVAPQERVGDCNLPAWLSVCANARRLWSVQMAGSARPSRQDSA